MFFNHRSTCRVLWVAASGLALLATNAIAQQLTQVDLSPAAVSTIYEELPDNNGGGFDEFCVGNLQMTSMTRRTLLRFDLSAIPAGAKIERVSLSVRQRLVRFMGNGPLSANLELRRITEDWVEGTGGSPNPGPQQKACGFGEDVAGVDWMSAPSRVGTVSGLGFMTETEGTKITMDSDDGVSNQMLVDDVQAWLDGTEANFGWLLQVLEENATDNARLLGNPVLTVWYSTDGPTLEINAGLNDAWLNFDTAGQGFFVTVFQETGLIFVAWFTFDTSLPMEDTANVGYLGHRWITAIGTWDGNKATLTFELTTDGLFDDPRDVIQTQGYGTLMLLFHDCNNVTAMYDIPAAGVMGSIELTRAVADNVALCQTLGYPE